MSESLRDNLSYDSNCFIEMLYQSGTIHGSSGMSIFVCYLSWCVRVGVGFGNCWWISKAPRDFGDKFWLPTRRVLDAWWRDWYISEPCILRTVRLERQTTWSTTRVAWSSTWFATHIYIDHYIDDLQIHHLDLGWCADWFMVWICVTFEGLITIVLLEQYIDLLC